MTNADDKIPPAEFRKIARKIKNEWRDVASELGLSESDVFAIEADNTGHREIVTQMLNTWSRKNGCGATYGVLAKALEASYNTTLAEEILTDKAGNVGNKPTAPPVPINSNLDDIDASSSPRKKLIPHYKMDSKPRGICLILSYEEFSNPLKNRKGNRFDIDNMKELFGTFNFTIECYNDLTLDETEKVVKKFADMDHKQYDSFITIVCSHGDETSFLTHDMEMFNIKESLINSFKGKKSLMNKPKIFFINACRGEAKQTTQFEKDDMSHDVVKKPPPNEADFLYSYATVHGYVGGRDPMNGTLFMQNIYKSFKENHKSMHLIEMLTVANKGLVSLAAENKWCQVGDFTTSLMEFVYFD